MIGNNKLVKLFFKAEQLGFTLIEILVTVAVYTIVVVVSSGIFINVSALQQQTANIQKLQNDGRYIVERLAKEIRSRELDYDAMDFNSDNTTNVLIFKKDEFGEVLSVYSQGANLIFEITDVNNVSKTAPINSKTEVAVDAVKFSVTPTSAESESLVQPKVTFLLSIKNITGQARFVKKIDLQTTISSKLY